MDVGIEEIYLDSLKENLISNLNKICKQHEVGTLSDIRFEHRMRQYLTLYTKEVQEVSIKASKGRII